MPGCFTPKIGHGLRVHDPPEAHLSTPGMLTRVQQPQAHTPVVPYQVGHRSGSLIRTIICSHTLADCCRVLVAGQHRSWVANPLLIDWLFFQPIVLGMLLVHTGLRCTPVYASLRKPGPNQHEVATSPRHSLRILHGMLIAVHQQVQLDLPRSKLRRSETTVADVTGRGPRVSVLGGLAGWKTRCR